MSETNETTATCSHPWTNELLSAAKALLAGGSIDEGMDRLHDVVERIGNVDHPPAP